MEKTLKALKAAFPHTIPVMTGYIFLGMAFGILLESKGYDFGWSILMSIFIYAGSMQFVAVNLLVSAFDPISAFLITLIVNSRHLFYGISMLEKFKGTGNKKGYLICGLTDETYSLLCSLDAPDGVDRTGFMFCITLLNQIYWVAASAAGSILGSVITIDTNGIDFVMTALFIVIFINQWKSKKAHAPAIIGIASSVICLMLFGAGSFIIPSMILIVTVLTVLRNRLEKEEPQ